MPRFSDIFSISGNALMNHFFSIVISFEKAKNGSLRFCGIRYTSSLNIHFFTTFGLILGPDFEIFSQISGNALMNHFFSIVISWETAKNGSCEVLRIRCTFSLKMQYFAIFGLICPHIFRYFLNFRKCAYESLL